MATIQDLIDAVDNLQDAVTNLTGEVNVRKSNLDSAINEAETAQQGAETAETNAETSASNALQSETNAGISEGNANTSAVNALASEQAAALSATKAEEEADRAEEEADRAELAANQFDLTGAQEFDLLQRDGTGFKAVRENVPNIRKQAFANSPIQGVNKGLIYWDNFERTNTERFNSPSGQVFEDFIGTSSIISRGLTTSGIYRTSTNGIFPAPTSASLLNGCFIRFYITRDNGPSEVSVYLFQSDTNYRQFRLSGGNRTHFHWVDGVSTEIQNVNNFNTNWSGVEIVDFYFAGGRIIIRNSQTGFTANLLTGFDISSAIWTHIGFSGASILEVKIYRRNP